MIGSGKMMVAEAMGIKPTKLWDQNRHKIKLADILYIPDFKKEIINLSKLLEQG